VATAPVRLTRWLVAIAALAACGGRAAAPPATTATSPAAAVTTTTGSTATTTSTTAPPPTTAGPSTTTTASTSSTTTTVAPIPTHAADISVLGPRTLPTPTRVHLPALAIDGTVLPGGVDATGELAVPPDARSLVWYRHGPSPGQAGSAVIAGHLDWRGVLGTFHDLADAPVGATVTVDYDDGTSRAFTVTAVELVDKPAVAVNGTFARDGDPLLRLVTCGGEYDGDVNRYRSNVVVTAIPA
jgi:hypothetical protein